MNIKNILNEIEQADPRVYQEVNDRRKVLKSFGSKVALAALPFAIGSLFQKASAKTTGTETPAEALNFALEMTYFAYNYYHTANNTGGLIPAVDQPGFLTIENQKKAQLLFLKTAVVSAGGVPYTPKNYDPNSANPLYIVNGAYDFTGGKYTPFSDYPTFVMLAEVFEDTFIHGFKGGIPAVLGTSALEQMMRMQAAGGRHAAHARYVRRQLGFSAAPEHPSPWITNNIPPDPYFQGYYNSEENVGQQNIDITALPGIGGNIPAVSASAAFDEAMDKGMVYAFLAPFMIV